MKWFDKLFKRSGSSPDDDDGEAGVHVHGHHFSHNGPHLFSGPRRNNEGTFYTNDRPAAGSSDLQSTTGTGERPSPNVNDEQLARAMQERQKVESQPTSENNHPPQHVPGAVPSSNCAGCNQPLGYGQFLSCLGKNWHPNCFCCGRCNKPISESEFSVQGDVAYHRECYKELFNPKCEVCHDFIPTNAAGMIEFRSHPFWNQKYCPKHEQDGTARCASCDRLQATDVQYARLEDGRTLCPECHETAILDTKACQPLYHDVLKFYEKQGLKIHQEIPMMLVERSALNAALESEKTGHAHTAETRGLCVSQEQTVTTIFGRTPSTPVSLFTQPQKQERHCEVTAILVLYGLPRLLTGSILAHELMHAWLRLDGGFSNLQSDVDEGISQVMAHIWLTGELENMRSKKSVFSLASKRNQDHDAIQARLGEFYLHQIETDSSPVYGEGFRKGYAAVRQFGLARTLEHLRQTKNFS
ncbi:hypothetical protein BDL97_19G058000 [Sphagnum fallax]|nr:hypothetical protein BDL97_19G058000 [Sphagnum fallax]